MSVIPQPSLHLVARKKAKAAVMGIGENASALAPPTRPPGGGAGYDSGSSASRQSGGRARAEPDAHPQSISLWLRIHS